MASIADTAVSELSAVPVSVVIALGSNLGDRGANLRRALHLISRSLTLVKISPTFETDPLESPPGAPRFLNSAAVGHTRLAPGALLAELHRVERLMGRRRPEVRNAPRTIDLDLIFYGGWRRRERGLEIPHPRWRQREFVTAPLRELNLAWLEGL